MYSTDTNNEGSRLPIQVTGKNLDILRRKQNRSLRCLNPDNVVDERAVHTKIRGFLPR